MRIEGGVMRLASRVTVGLIALAVAASGWAQTTTGRLIGNVVDGSGAALPGVSVTIASPALIGGTQSKVTDARGEYGFIGIAPGEYTVRAELTGFIAQERGAVKVPLGGAAAVMIAMPAGTFTGEIEVVDETPVVDPTQVNSEQIFEQTYMQNSAIGSVNRNYLMIVNQAAGVAGGGSWAPPSPGCSGPRSVRMRTSSTVWTRPIRSWRPQSSHGLRHHRGDPGPDRGLRGRVRACHRRHRQSGDPVRRKPVLRRPRHPVPRSIIPRERGPLRYLRAGHLVSAVLLYIRRPDSS